MKYPFPWLHVSVKRVSIGVTPLISSRISPQQSLLGVFKEQRGEQTYWSQMTKGGSNWQSRWCRMLEPMAWLPNLLLR